MTGKISLKSMEEIKEILQLSDQDIDKTGFDESDKDKLKKVVQLQEENNLTEGLKTLNEITLVQKRILESKS